MALSLQKKNTNELCYARNLMFMSMKILLFSPSPHFPNKFHCQVDSLFYIDFQDVSSSLLTAIAQQIFVWKYFFPSRSGCSLLTPLQYYFPSVHPFHTFLLSRFSLLKFSQSSHKLFSRLIFKDFSHSDLQKRAMHFTSSFST